MRLIDDEVRRKDWQLDLVDGTGDIREEKKGLFVELISNHVFSWEGLEGYHNASTYGWSLDWFDDFKPVPDELRVKTFDIPRDQEVINALHEQVERCREYLNDLSKNIYDYLKIAS